MSENRLCRFNHVTSQCRSFLIVFMQNTSFYLHININNLDMFYEYMYVLFYYYISLFIAHYTHSVSQLVCIQIQAFLPKRNFRARKIMWLFTWYVGMKLKKFLSDLPFFSQKSKEYKKFFFLLNVGRMYFPRNDRGATMLENKTI